jgi:diguanylate cyclase (GGDEF)-like protein
VSTAQSGDNRVSLAIVGGGPRAEVLLRALLEIDNVVVSGVWCPPGSDAVAAIARVAGVLCTDDMDKLFEIPHLGLIIDASDDPHIYPQLELDRPARISLIGGAGSDLITGFLMEKRQAREQERLFLELQGAYQKIRTHERRLESSKEALEKANIELEGRFAEIFFTHEFFKALTGFTSVDDVCSLIVDGCNGILGAQISCVYLCNREDWTLELRASQGRPQYDFRLQVPINETILGRAYREGPVNQPDALADSSSTAWALEPGAIASQAAVPLIAGSDAIGVMVMASTGRRDLSAVEMERLEVLGSQASLALQNALLHEELERLSVTDRLTDLYNHGYFKQRLEEEFQRSVRFGHPLSLIMLDIDDFKEFNDSFGHPCGDAVLKSLSTIIRKNLREMDIAARYGGEEFVLVLPETRCDGATMVAERIRAEFEQVKHEVAETLLVSRTVSIGVASYPGSGETAMSLLERADAAMYAGKRAGKNRVVAAGC